MAIPDLERLRRFALMSGLVLLTFSLAGISLEPDTRLSPFGIPFRVSRPDLLPIGLILASTYGALKFYYYGMMLQRSPFRRRRELLDGLHLKGGKRAPIGMYLGPTEFVTIPGWLNHGPAKEFKERALQLFPRFWKARVTAELWTEEGPDDEGGTCMWYGVSVTIPVRCRFVALLQDIDFAAPVWLNLFSVGLAVMSII